MPTTVYHVATRDVRASIKRHGIDTRRFAAARRRPSYEIFDERGSFVFNTRSQARGYAVYMAGTSGETMDVWHLAPTSDLVPDDTLFTGGDREENEGAFLHLGFRRPARRVETVPLAESLRCSNLAAIERPLFGHGVERGSVWRGAHSHEITTKSGHVSFLAYAHLFI